MKVEVMAARIAPADQTSNRKQGSAADQKCRHLRRPARKLFAVSSRQGTSRRVCVVDAVTAASVKGMANVLPPYQYGHWSR